MGLDEHETEIYTDDKFPNPNITEDYTTFPVICDIAKDIIILLLNHGTEIKSIFLIHI